MIGYLRHEYLTSKPQEEATSAEQKSYEVDS